MMKDKIFNALKTEYKTLGLGDKALDGVASFLEKTITNEDDIINRVKGDDVVMLLKAFQGESDSLRNARVKAEKELSDYKAAHPSDKNLDSDDPTSKTIEEFRTQMASMQARLEASEKRNRVNDLMKSVRAKMKENGSTNDAILDITLNPSAVGDEDTEDSLVSKFQAVYDTNYTKFYGNRPRPQAGGSKSEGYKAGDYAKMNEMLQREGLLPKKSN